MVRITEDQLETAFAAIEEHGYGDFFPKPPEIEVIRDNWDSIRSKLSEIDLDTYIGYDRVTTFAPKSRLAVRRVSLLHPFDLIIYTALVLSLRDEITAARLSSSEDRVFSYRAEDAAPYLLYTTKPSYLDFKNRVEERVADESEAWVGVSDIGDFYPRIYQHRLINALQAAAGDTKRDQIRVLEKMLFRFADGTSYGIPVGPPASRPLGEAVLIDVDSTLRSYGIDFIRFTDDFLIFAATPEAGEYGIRILAETLFLNHGLTLQTAKTRVMKASEYLEKYLTPHSEKETNRRKLLEIVGGYDESTSYEELDEDGKREIDALNLSEMLKDALAEGQNVNYKEVSFILGRLSALQKPELIPTVLENLSRLNPVAHSVASFFREFISLPKSTTESITAALLAPLLDRDNIGPSEYYCIWILSVFHSHKDWNHADNLLRILRETNSDAIRRYAALALMTSGTRAQVAQISKYLASASPLCRTAILLATTRMGSDERKYLRQTLHLSDALEKLCAVF